MGGGQDHKAPDAAGILEEREASAPPENALVAGALVPTTSAGPWVAECVDNAHPSIVGRVLVRVSPPRGPEVVGWVPALQGLSIRPGDRVLLQRAENWPEPIVTGVVDGFARRPSPSRQPAARIAVLPDEVVRVEASAGTPLVEVHQGERGAVVRLVEPDVELELPGELRIKAKRIAMSSDGEVEIRAVGDVNVKGEIINLN